VKSFYEFSHDRPTVDLLLNPKIRKNFPAHRIIWNYKGMRGVIPPTILLSQFQLIEEYKSRLRSYDVVPPGVGMIEWDCVVRVP